MFLSDFSIKRPVVTIVIVMALMALGLLALGKLRVNEIPDVQQPVLVVNIAYPGASPETVEREVINRIEKSLQSVTGVYEIRATAKDSSAQFVIFFNFRKNMIEASDEVRNAIATVRYKLPVEMREPVLIRVDPNSNPIMNLALSSTKQTQAEISRMAEDQLSDRLRGIEGVATVEVNGALKRELSILLQSDRMRAYNVGIGDVIAAVQGANTNAPVGRIVGPLKDQSIRLIGRIESPSEFGQIIVKRQGEQVVRLAQVAQTVDGFAERNSFSLRSANPNVGLYVTRARDASTVSVANAVRAMVAEINKTLPEGTRLDVTYDGGEGAQDNLNNVIHALSLGAVLTIAVVFVFLNSWRSTLITALSLPTSAIAAFIAVWLCGFTLNFMTLLGLSLAIGVLIDDAIVVRENIVRHMERGADRMTAARAGTAEIGMAVAATTFSIIAIFIPVAFMPGVAGEWFRPFALTVACSVMVSLFISFTLDPMLSAYWGDPIGYHHAQNRSRLSVVLRRFNDWFDHQADRYGDVIAWALHHRRWMAVAAIASLAAAAGLHAAFGGQSFLPVSDSDVIAIEVRTPSSASLEYTRLKVEKAAELARTMPETIATNSRVNIGGGRVYVDIGKTTSRDRTSQKIAVDLRKLMAQLVGAEYVVLDDMNNGARKPVEIRFYGTDTRTLLDITNAFMVRMRTIPGAVDVGLSELSPKDELRIEMNRGLANSLGISVNDAAQALRVAFAGVEVGDWIDPAGQARDVAVRLDPAHRVDSENIERLPIVVPGTNMVVPLNQIATVSMGVGPAQIQHLNGRRMIAVSANAQGRASGDVTKDALALAKSLDFPAGYGVELGGAGKDQKEVFSAMLTALIMGVGCMYLILVMQFGSFTAPLGVMVSLPLSLIGVVIALVITRSTINLMSFIGIIMLMGLVAKNAILLLDAARKREADGEDRETALMAAGRSRLRPILMTTFALIAGMLPVAIGIGEGGDFYRPMAIAIIGGTITSTFLTLLVVPAFYDSIEIARDRMLAKFHRRTGSHNTVVAFGLTMVEALLALTMVRGLYRAVAMRFARRAAA
ncbi:efflux RND transporter permease subunit [Caenimonas sp. SL110]|uniref:efflux RND transporter permease subunit n=1 Tax=Caenimonas sp. SL110 TaxID=1450524 RepID=UPI0006539844|nr:efflux RND transporter permease subunit [Caenimonas sp. SL110]